jgi:thioredoxin 1
MEKKQTFSELIRGDRPVLVDFHAEWCGPCKMMSPIIEQFSAEMGDTLRVIKVDVDKNPLAASAYRVQGVPTVMLFQNGEVLWRQSGVVPAHILRQVVERYVKPATQN